MNLSQIEEMKTTIKSEYEAKIKKLEDEMRLALASFSKTEETLRASNIIQNEVDSSAKSGGLFRRNRPSVPDEPGH